MQTDIVRALGIHGWMDPLELQWLSHRAAESQSVIEIGTWKGRSTRALADHLPVGGTLIVVDDWIDARDHVDGTTAELVVATRKEVEAEWRANLADHLEAGRIVLARGNSPDVAPFLVPRLPNGQADFVFIDGNHSYDGVLADILAYEPLVRAGGILAGHDYTTSVHPGVRQAVDEYFVDKVQQGSGSIWWVRL